MKPRGKIQPSAAQDTMIRTQIVARGVDDTNVLDAMRDVPRELFVPEALRSKSCDDTPLPIGFGQTISQPYIVALMTQLCCFTGKERVLEIGTGSGYQSALLASLCLELFTVERIPELTQRASSVLEKLGFSNIHFITGNGYDGVPDEAPFDVIILTAAPKEIPETLVSQLSNGGRLVAPEGERIQELVVLTKKDGIVSREPFMYVRFVEMVR